MGTFRGLLTDVQMQSIVDSITSKSKLLFVKRSTYENKVSELESTIADLSARVLDLEKFHYPSAEENPPIEVEEEEEP